MNAAAGAERVGKVRVVAQRMSGGMTAGDLRSLVGDIRGKLGTDPAVVALIAEGSDGAVPYVVAVNDAAQDLGLSRQRSGQAACPRRSTAAAAARPTWLRARARTPTGIDAALDALRAEVARS